MSEARSQKSEAKGARKYSIRRATARDLPELKRMRVALQDLLVGRDPRVWRFSHDLTDRLEDFNASMMEKDENRVFVAAAAAGRPVGMRSIASLQYLRMLDPSTLPGEKDKIRKDLLAYCGHDTL